MALQIRSSDAVLRSLLKGCGPPKYHIEYYQKKLNLLFLSNHAAHGILSMYYTGATDGQLQGKQRSSLLCSEETLQSGFGQNSGLTTRPSWNQEELMGKRNCMKMIGSKTWVIERDTRSG